MSYLHPNIHEVVLQSDRRADIVIVMIDCHNYCGLRVEVVREVDNLEKIYCKWEASMDALVHVHMYDYDWKIEECIITR